MMKSSRAKPSMALGAHAHRPLALMAGAAALAHVAQGRVTWGLIGVLAAILCFVGWAQRAARVIPVPLWSIFGIVTSALSIFSAARPVSVDAAISLLIAMLALKLFELKQTRDWLFAWLAALMVFAASVLHATSPLQLVAVVAFAWLSASALLTLDRPVAWRPLTVRTGKLIALGLPVAALFFVLFPRLAAPLWGFGQGNEGKTGLSERLQPGAIARLSLSDEIAFRAEFEGPLPPVQARYWRGPVLASFDGEAFSVDASEGYPRAVSDFLPNDSSQLRYSVSLEPTRLPWLPTLDVAASIPEGDGLVGPAMILSTRQALVRLPPAQGARYRMRAALSDRYASQGLSRSSLLTGPSSQNQQARALGLQLALTHPDPRARVNAVLASFGKAPFRYTLEPPLMERSAIDAFLFEHQAGFCEHYSAAFVFLMRASGVPARVVTGYLGGEINPRGNYLIVRQADAHAWAEVLIDGTWQRVDPTAAIAPERIESGPRAALPENERGRLNDPAADRWYAPALFAWDSTLYGYRTWVLGFNRERQRTTLQSFGIGGKSAAELLGLALLGAVALGTLVIGVVLWRERQGRELDRELVRWRAFETRLRKAGLMAANNLGPLSLAEHAAAHWPQHAGVFLDYARAFVAVRYGTLEKPAASDAARQLSAKWRLVQRLALPKHESAPHAHPRVPLPG